MNAEKLAKKLASDCYMSAVKFFSSLLVIVFATCFLIYYTFKNGTPQNLSGLMVFAFFQWSHVFAAGFRGFAVSNETLLQAQHSNLFSP